MNRSASIRYVLQYRWSGLGLAVLLCLGCAITETGGVGGNVPTEAKFKYAKQSAALMEMQEREARSVPGSIPSMAAFPLASEQGSAVSDQ